MWSASRPLASLLLGTLLALSFTLAPEAATSVRAASPRCTDWDSYTRPPETIWVELHERSASGAPAGTRVQVDFRTYVERVVTLEWGPSEVSRAQLMSAALVVKQYAWWYVMHPSSERRDRNGDCFDIGSTTKYQLYRESASASPARTKLIRSAIEAVWSTSVWKTSGYRKGPAHTGYRAGAYAEGCQPGVSGFHLFQQNARKCAREGESAEALIRRYYGPNVALFDPRTMTLGGIAVGPLWRVTPDRRLWSSGSGAPWVNHGRLLPEPLAGELSLGVAVIDALRTSEALPGYSLVELRLGADRRVRLVEVAPETSPGAARAEPLVAELPEGWLGVGDRYLLLPGDFDGDLLPEIGLLRLRDSESAGVSAELASLERSADGWSWRSPIWSVSDLASRGIDPWRLAASVGDVNGDGVSDLALLSATLPDDPLVASAPTTLHLASSLGLRWDPRERRYPDPVLGEPRLIDRIEAPIEQTRLFALDRDGDGADELVIARTDPAGLLQLELLRFPSRSALPLCSETGGCRRLWLRSDPALGPVDLASLSLDVQLVGVRRDERGRREPDLRLFVSASFALGGERSYAIDPSGELPTNELTPALDLLPLGSIALVR